MTDADESELAFDGDEPWATGGNAEIFAVRWNRRLFFYKRYLPEHRTAVAGTALERMLAWRTGLPAPEQRRLDDCCAWPRAVVRAGTEIRGVLVPPAPEIFMTRWAGRRTARSLSKLPLFAADITDETAEAHVPEVLAALGHTAGVLRWLHGHDVIVNDVQPENVLVDDETARVFLVDCDSMVSRHWGGSIASVTAPSYISAVVPGDPSPSVDLAKLAWCTFLLLLRDFSPSAVNDWVSGSTRRYLTGSTVTLLTEAITNRSHDPRWETFWAERAEQWIMLGREGVLVTDAGMRQVAATVPAQRTEPFGTRPDVRRAEARPAEAPRAHVPGGGFRQAEGSPAASARAGCTRNGSVRPEGPTVEMPATEVPRADVPRARPRPAGRPVTPQSEPGSPGWARATAAVLLLLVVALVLLLLMLDRGVL